MGRVKAKTPPTSSQMGPKYVIYILYIFIPFGFGKDRFVHDKDNHQTTAQKSQPQFKEWVVTHGSHAMVLIYPINGAYLESLQPNVRRISF